MGIKMMLQSKHAHHVKHSMHKMSCREIALGIWSLCAKAEWIRFHLSSLPKRYASLVVCLKQDKVQHRALGSSFYKDMLTLSQGAGRILFWYQQKSQIRDESDVQRMRSDTRKQYSQSDSTGNRSTSAHLASSEKLWVEHLSIQRITRSAKTKVQDLRNIFRKDSLRRSRPSDRKGARPAVLSVQYQTHWNRRSRVSPEGARLFSYLLMEVG